MVGCRSCCSSSRSPRSPRPAGRYMALVFAGKRTWLDRVLRPVERGIYRACRIDPTREMRWTEYAAALLAFSCVSMLALYALQRLQGWLPFNPQGFGAVSRRTRVQHGRVVHDQHELAGLRRRVDDELSHPDGRPRVPQLRLGGGRHRARDRVHSRHRAARTGDDRQLLGGHHARPAVDSAAGLRRRRAGASCRRESSRTSKPTTSCRCSRAAARRRSRRARSRRRRRSSSSAPTAAASSMRTARTRSRIRRRSRIFLAMFLIFLIPAGLTWTLGDMTGSRRHGWAVWAAMAFLFVGGRQRDVLGGSARQPAARRRRSAGQRRCRRAATWRARKSGSASRTRRCSRR